MRYVCVVGGDDITKYLCWKQWCERDVYEQDWPKKKLMTTIALAEFIRKRSIINRMHEAQFNLTLIYSDIRFSQAWNWMKTFLFLFTSKISYKFHLFEDVFIPMLFDSMLPVRNDCSSESDRWELFRRTWHFTFTFQLPLGAVKETSVEFLMIWESWKRASGELSWWKSRQTRISNFPGRKCYFGFHLHHFTTVEKGLRLAAIQLSETLEAFAKCPQWHRCGAALWLIG